MPNGGVRWRSEEGGVSNQNFVVIELCSRGGVLYAAACGYHYSLGNFSAATKSHALLTSQ